MKQLFLILSFVVTLGVSAQENPEKKAKKLANEFTQVLSLNEEESKSIYEIQLERFKSAQSINKEFADQPEIKEEKLKLLGDKVFNQIKEVLGMDRQKQWKEYKSKKQ
jgi:pantothenate kinase type III